MNVRKHFAAILLSCAAVAPALSPTAVRGQDKPSVEPRAEQVLRAAVDYLLAAEQFSFRVESTGDRVLSTGQKIQHAAVNRVHLRRPDRFRATYDGDTRQMDMWYDGVGFTMLNVTDGAYATWSATGDIDGLLDRLRAELGFLPPLMNLLHADLYEQMMSGVRTGFYVGASPVGGVPCHHLAFTQDRIDWQLWVEEGSSVVIRKYLVTLKEEPGAPQFTAVFTDWDFESRLADFLFTFVPPAGAVKVDFLPVGKMK